MPRFHCPTALAEGATLSLPASAARHVQVLRMQPGDAMTLFTGEGGEFSAEVLQMGRSDVQVRIGRHLPLEREARRAVHLAVGMPANERMDWLVEKATELGVASIQPLHTAHGVLRLAADRAEKKRAHWQAIAVAACEQCGRNRVPQILPVAAVLPWLAALDAGGSAGGHARLVLSLLGTPQDLRDAAPQASLLVLSGPEGGLSADEELQARQAGFRPATLGPRVLRAETAAIAAVALSQ